MNEEGIESLEKRTTEIEASIEFNDSDRAAIKDHIKLIEQRKKDSNAKINQLKITQESPQTTCRCSKRLDALEQEAKKKNILVIGVPESKGERLTYIVLEILSNTEVPVNHYDIEQTIRIGSFRTQGPPRPILVKFRDYTTKENVMLKRNQIKINPQCKNIWLNNDLIEETKRVRAEMKTLGDLAVNLGHTVILRGNGITIDGISYNENTLDTLPTHLSLERAYIRETPNGLAFHSRHAFMSNFSPAQFEYENISFKCSEQAIQWKRAKVHKQEAIAKEILNTDNPVKMKRLGDRIKLKEEWLKSQDHWVEIFNDAKYDQNPLLARKLAETKQAPLLECTKSAHWGIGMSITHPDLYRRSFKPKGKNTMGKILEKKRLDIQRTIAAAAASVGSGPQTQRQLTANQTVTEAPRLLPPPLLPLLPPTQTPIPPKRSKNKAISPPPAALTPAHTPAEGKKSTGSQDEPQDLCTKPTCSTPSAGLNPTARPFSTIKS